MGKKKNYAVLGLGRYGKSVATELVANGAEVLAVDFDNNVADECSTIIPACKCADITEPEVINQLGIGEMDTVIIAMAGSLESTVMAIMLCKEAGVETVIAKCANETHKKIYEKVGADRVIFPESESGIRLAKNLLSSGFVDMIDLSDNISMVELEVKDGWVGKNLAELDLRKKYLLNVVAIKTDNMVNPFIDPNIPLEKTMRLIVIADTSKLEKLK